VPEENSLTSGKSVSLRPGVSVALGPLFLCFGG